MAENNNWPTYGPERQKIQELMNNNMNEENQKVEDSLFWGIANSINNCEKILSENPSREISLVKTKLEEALMWFSKIK